MKLIKSLFVLFAITAFSAAVYGQEHPEGMPPRKMERPSTFELVDEVRNSLGLENKEFDKTYSAYEKYEKSVFGDNSNNLQTGRRQGPPPGMGGRMGGPGGPRPGGMERPQGGFHEHEHPRQADDNRKSVDVDKFKKEKDKAEEKLSKSMKKIFKKDPEKYEKWLTLREQQLKKLFPPIHHKKTDTIN